MTKMWPVGLSLALTALIAGASPLRAEDVGGLVLRGFVSQGFLKSSSNKLLTTDSDARSLYRALVLSLNKKYSKGWQMQANWVISDDKSGDDNERDPFTIRYADYLDLNSEYSLSDRHSRHRLNVFGLFDLPADVQLTALVQYRSANPTTGTDLLGQDLNNDGQANDRRYVNGKDLP